MPPIAFDTIPSNLNRPLFHAEIRGAQTPYAAGLKMMLVGHKAAANTVGLAHRPYRLSGEEAVRLFGRGSMLEAMYRAARRQSPSIEIWGVAVAPDAGAVTSQGAIEVTTTPNLTGTLTVWIAAYPVSVPVRSGDTKAALAGRLRTAISAATHLPVLAALDGVNTAKIVLSAKWAGASGNQINIERMIHGSDPRLAQFLTVTAMANGAGNATLTDGLAAIDERAFDVLAIGNQAEAAQVAELDDYFNRDSGRWSPSKQSYGHAFCAYEASYANLITYGAARNGPHVTVMGLYNTPTPQWEWAAAVGARATLHWAEPPELSRPLQSLELHGVVAARDPGDRFSDEERSALIDAGLSTCIVDADGTVRIERLVTCYKTNAWGDPDRSWRDPRTMFQSMYLVRSFRAKIQGLYPRAALTDEDSGIPGFVSPEQIKDCIISEYRRLQGVGLVENTEIFADALIVERNATDPDRVDAFVKADMVNAFGALAALIETNLTSDTIQAA